MKALRLTVVSSLTAIVVAVSFSDVARAERERPIVLGQTEGFANGELTVFDYGQNFICANAPLGPLNAADCQVGAGFTSLELPGVKLNSAGIPDLIVIAPFFDANGDGTLEALASSPAVFVQSPETQSSVLGPGGTPIPGATPFGVFGHCIFHDTMLDTSPLAGVTVAGVTFGGTIPLPNHSHIVAATPGNAEQPWDIKVVLVLDPALWPDANGNCPAGSGCLTSFEAIASAPASSIVGPVDSTLVLFFGVHGLEP